MCETHTHTHTPLHCCVIVYLLCFSLCFMRITTNHGFYCKSLCVGQFFSSFFILNWEHCSAHIPSTDNTRSELFYQTYRSRNGWLWGQHQQRFSDLTIRHTKGYDMYSSASHRMCCSRKNIVRQPEYVNHHTAVRRTECNLR